MDKKTARRKPRGPDYIPSHHLSRVPEAVSLRVETMLRSVGAHGDRLEAQQKQKLARKRMKIIHLPDRKGFERLFLIGRLGTPEIKVDRETSRVYLLGSSTPGREERQIETRPVEDEAEIIAEQVYTDVVNEHNDIVVGYTETSFPAFQQAKEKKERLDDHARYGLGQFFQVPPSKLTGVILALRNYSFEEIESIGLYALREKGMV